MILSLLLAQQIAVQFLWLLVGFILIRVKILKEQDATVLSKIVLYVTTPCMVLMAFQVELTDTVRNSLVLAFAAGAMASTIIIFLSALFKRIFRLDDIDQMSMSYPNCGNLVFPLVAATIGNEWTMFSCPFWMFQIFLLFTHGEHLMRGTKKISLRNLVLNINIIAIMLAMFLFFAKIMLPRIIISALSGFSVTVGPMSMLVIGMSIGNADFKKIFTTGRIYFVCLCRLIILPLVFILVIKISGAAYLFDDAKQILMLTVIGASSSVAVAVVQMAQACGRDSSKASCINVMSVLFLIVTMPVMVAIYEVIV